MTPKKVRNYYRCPVCQLAFSRDRASAGAASCRDCGQPNIAPYATEDLEEVLASYRTRRVDIETEVTVDACGKVLSRRVRR